MKQKELTLTLFAHEPGILHEAMAAGIRDFIVDCEWRGKVERQTGADTDTSHVEVGSVAQAAAVPGGFVNCRINHLGPWSEQEIEAAIAGGAQQIFLPMLRTMSEAETFIRLIDGRTRPAILVETDEAVRIARDLATLPLTAVYVGLNDLAISRNQAIIFESLIDGTVEALRECFHNLAFGFGGVTILGCGHPVPGVLLLAEMSRLNCDFSFLRRSYKRDVTGKDAASEVGRLRSFWQRLGERDTRQKSDDWQLLDACIRGLLAKPCGWRDQLSTQFKYSGPEE